jgi:hypothetical protein
MSQIIFLLLALSAPCFLLAYTIRIPVIYKLSQNNPRTRYLIIIVIGFLCLGITYILMLWLAQSVIFGIAKAYFDFYFGSVSGITRFNIAQFELPTVNELWLRQVVPNSLNDICFNSNRTVCQLADQTKLLGSFDSIRIWLVFFSLFPTSFNILLSRHLSRPSTTVNSNAG